MIDRTVRAVGSQRRQWLVIAGCGAIPIAVALALVPLGYPLDGAGVQIAVYSSGYLIAGSIAWLRRPDNPVGPVMLAYPAMWLVVGIAFWAFDRVVRASRPESPAPAPANESIG